MSTTKKLRLGPLPKTENVKLTFACPASLKADLDHYAALHAQAYGEAVDPVTLIPHMLEAFMAGDRGFKRSGGPSRQPMKKPPLRRQRRLPNWCPRSDSNRQALRRRIFFPLRLSPPTCTGQGVRGLEHAFTIAFQP